MIRIMIFIRRQCVDVDLRRSNGGEFKRRFHGGNRGAHFTIHGGGGGRKRRAYG
jgi:hypothetical protein